MALDGTVTTSLSLPATATPAIFACGPDGKLWLTVDHGVGRIGPQGPLTMFPVGDEAFHPTIDTQPLTAGADGAVWGIDQLPGDPQQRAFVRIRPDGSRSRVPGPFGVMAP